LNLWIEEVKRKSCTRSNQPTAGVPTMPKGGIKGKKGAQKFSSVGLV